RTILLRAGALSQVAHEVHSGFQKGMATMGFAGIVALFLRAYSMGAGTYTGIEAVSNGLAIMREPKVETGKRTMVYMAISLAVTAGGILLCYLLVGVKPVENCDPTLPCWTTMNALLAQGVAGRWHLGPVPLGRI